jgi:sterol desaturase/sphingolipid hydroxylase (fatty acid hydroxylase superfamily)
MSIGAILSHEGAIRSACFVAVLALCGFAEHLQPLRSDHGPPWRRLRNFSLVVIDSLLLRFAFPMLVVGFAIFASDKGIGLFNMGVFDRLVLPSWLLIGLSLLLLDLGIYWQHRLMHALPLLWRLHRVHHSDTVFDVSMGVRFHPIEIAFSMSLKLALVAIIGAPPLAVLIYEITLSAASLFTHTNITLPLGLQRGLRHWIVTPDMHRVHHSVHRDETDSNYGSVLVLWDRCFRSFRAAPRTDQNTMSFGIEGFDASASSSLIGLLLQPFRKTPTVPR